MPAPRSTPTRLLGKRMRARRNALGISQEALADRSGTHWTFVGQVERGQRNISLHNLLKLADGLQLDPGELVRGLGPTEREFGTHERYPRSASDRAAEP